MSDWQVIHYLSSHTFIPIVTLIDSRMFTLVFFFVFCFSLKSTTTHYHLPLRPQIRFKLLFKFYSVFFPHFFGNAIYIVLATPSQISSLSLSQDKFLIVFHEILFQSKLKAQIFYTCHPIEVFLLFYFHPQMWKFSPILL